MASVEHLLERLRARPPSRRRRLGQSLGRGRLVEPVDDERFERVAVARHRLDGVVVGGFQRLEPPQHVGRLTEDQPEVSPVERDVLEAEQRPALLRAARFSQSAATSTHGIGTRPSTRRWSSRSATWRSTASAQLGLARLELLQLDDFARLRAAQALAWFGHGRIVAAGQGKQKTARQSWSLPHTQSRANRHPLTVDGQPSHRPRFADASAARPWLTSRAASCVRPTRLYRSARTKWASGSKSLRGPSATALRRQGDRLREVGARIEVRLGQEQPALGKVGVELDRLLQSTRPALPDSRAARRAGPG